MIKSSSERLEGCDISVPTNERHSFRPWRESFRSLAVEIKFNKRKH